jgi:hypothetical protein
VPEPTLGAPIHPQLRELLPEDGPTLDEVKGQQRAESELLGNIATGTQTLVHLGRDHYIEHRVIKFAERAVEHAFGSATLASKIAHVAAALVTLQLAYEITEGAHDLTVRIPMERGKKVAESSDRDQRNLALLMIVQVSQPDVLPDGYLLHEQARVLGAAAKTQPFGGWAFQKASSLLGKAETDPELARSRDILVAAMREGVATAYQRGIDSKGALERLKETDPGFRSRYESDPAFRNGINSVVWLATFHRDEYDAAAALSAGRRPPTRI